MFSSSWLMHALTVRALPKLLFAAMRRPRLAVMVARGDLGVEVGFARLSEVQEEVLWLCEAARVPVMWATQARGDDLVKLLHIQNLLIVKFLSLIFLMSGAGLHGPHRRPQPRGGDGRGVGQQGGGGYAEQRPLHQGGARAALLRAVAHGRARAQEDAPPAQALHRLIAAI